MLSRVVAAFFVLPACSFRVVKLPQDKLDGKAVAMDSQNASALAEVASSSLGGDSAKNIVELAAGNTALKKLVAALTKAELLETLKATGPFTVFAPNDAAFEKKYPGTKFDELTKEQLLPVLKYHVISGTQYKSGDLKEGFQEVTTLEQDKKLPVTKVGDVVKIWKESPYEATVTVADNLASNGVVHIIDAVLVVQDNIVEFADGNTALKKLVLALTKAELLDDLKAAGPFTVFAPNDAAFEKKYGTEFDELTKAQLLPVLKYHVISGAHYTYGFEEGDQQLTTLEQDKKLNVNRAGDVVKVGPTATASTATSGALASNGKVYIIDAVLDVPDNIVELDGKAVAMDSQNASALAEVASSCKPDGIKVKSSGECCSGKSHLRLSRAGPAVLYCGSWGGVADDALVEV